MIALSMLALVARGAQAQNPTLVEPTLVVGGLTKPTGIALQPETGVVFVSDSGAGRIVRIADGKLEAVIEGSRTGDSDTANREAVGPLALAFFDRQTLVVGDGGYSAGADCVRIFKLPEEPAKVLAYEADAQTKLGPLPAKDGNPAVGFFVGLALAKHGLYVTSDGDADHGWVLKSDIRGTKFGELQRTIRTKTDSTVGFPTGIALSSRGEVVVGLMGAAETPGDSQLAFYSAKTNELLLKLEIGLHDISAIGYSPKTGLLYATDFAYGQPAEGGLYRLDSDLSAGRQKIKAAKIARLDRPSALAFDKEGTAYVTVQGSAVEGEKPAGAVVKVSNL